MRKRAYKKISGFRLISTAVVGMSLGALLGAVLLMIKPPAKVTSIPTEEVAKERPGLIKVYYQPGLKAAGGPSLPFIRSYKLMNMKQPGMLPFTEQDINAYFDQLEVEPAGEGGEEKGGMRVGKPNVRVTEEGIVLSVSSTINPGSPQKLDMTTQIYGHFEMGSEGPYLKVDKLYLNSLRVPLLGGLVGSKLRESLLAGAVPAETAEAWARIDKIDTIPGQLTVTMGVSGM